MREYAIVSYDYIDAIRKLRKLRRRGVDLNFIIIYVRTSHWNKVKDMLNSSNSYRGRKIIVMAV